ncbi:hypothetical protein [Streptococcus salivarius]
MKKTIQNITKTNTAISCLSIWIPVCLLFIETLEKFFGEKNWFSQILIKANLKFWLSFIVFGAVCLAFRFFLKLAGNDRSETINLYLNNNFKMVSQKLFSCLVTMAGILFLTDNNNNAWSLLIFLLSISVTNALSFWSLYVMTDNKKEKKDVYYFWIAMCMVTSLLSTVLFFVSAVNLTLFLLMPFNLLFPGYWGFYIVLGAVFYRSYLKGE